MEFKQITSDQDWSDAATIRNRFFWNQPLTSEEMRTWYAQAVASGRPDQRVLGYEDGEPVAYGGARKNIHSEGGKDYWLMVCVDPAREDNQRLFGEMLDHATKIASDFGAETIRFEARSDYEWSLHAFQARGFDLSTRLPVSSLKLQERVTSMPILAEEHRILSCNQLKAERPSTWDHDCWRVEMDVAADLPLPFPFVESSLEDYREELNDPLLNFDAQFYYLVGEEIAGVTQLFPSLINPKLALNGLTGTRRDFRRQGIATRLKQASAHWAKLNGIEEIFTDNEENNPMYQLNLQLGFEHRFDNLVYSRAAKN